MGWNISGRGWVRHPHILIFLCSATTGDLVTSREFFDFALDFEITLPFGVRFPSIDGAGHFPTKRTVDIVHVLVLSNTICIRDPSEFVRNLTACLHTLH